MNEPGRRTAFLEPANEHGHVRALAAAVGVQLVEDQEPQPAADAIEEPLILGPHQHQLGHHVVGQHDLRRMLSQLFARGLRSVAGVLGERHRERPAGAPFIAVLELLQRLELRVDQGVHRIDDERRDPVAGGRLPQQGSMIGRK